MTDKNDSNLSRRDLLRIGGLALLATGCSNYSNAQITPLPTTIRPIRESGMAHVIITADNPSLVRDRAHCTRCGQCHNYCYRSMTAHGFRSSEGRMSCIYCGQCSIQCKPRSITERSEIAEFQAALADPDKIVITTVAPAVRVALGEMFQMPPGSFVEDKTVAALKQLGCDYILDTTFGADLTIMEEASELLHHLERDSGSKYPLFTSCCPAWVRFAELFTPQLVPHISTTKSPILMQGASIKTYFAQQNGLDPKRIFNVAIAPCTAKKAEIKRPGSNTLTDQPGFEGLSEVDLVLTVRELGRLLQETNVDFPNLPNSSFDSLMGRGSGGAMAFGRSGGVMESALRTAYYLVNKENAPLQKDVEMRGEVRTVNWVNPMPFQLIAGVRQDTVDFGGRTIRVAVVETPGSLRGLLDAIEHDGERFDFVEVMACQGGCLGGGGQPYPEQLGDILELIYDRRDAVQLGVDGSAVRLSHENAEVALAYREFFGEPLGEKAKMLLHCR
ncbi:MAG: iron hydrogenase small subunit [Planctomycetaceae bacterium]|nr:iron hydrogenase small subunit [Planctomycetaceae bacterium]